MAPRAATNKRERLMEAAKSLIHQQGFNQTTLADIAKESGVPLGNVYYYFKTKDDIAAAVIDEYRQAIERMLEELEDREPDPKKRLIYLVKRMSSVKDQLASFGCPVGSLCQELNKAYTPLAVRADDIIKAQIRWTTEQFKLLGKKDAADLAVQLIASLQGTSLLANAMQNPDVAGRQLTRIANWINEM
jgi:TetR/AcrR family transcriptional regulator, transcriptional repressor for nem operon